MRPAHRYAVEMGATAERELDELRAFDAHRILRAILELKYEAETETRNRKRLRRPVRGLPAATWEVRVGDFRVLYEVRKDQIVWVLRVILKRLTVDDAAGGSRDE